MLSASVLTSAAILENYSIDLIRVIACAAVIGLHTFPKDLSAVTGVLYYLCGFAVPFFYVKRIHFVKSW